MNQIEIAAARAALAAQYDNEAAKEAAHLSRAFRRPSKVATKAQMRRKVVRGSIGANARKGLERVD